MKSTIQLFLTTILLAVLICLLIPATRLLAQSAPAASVQRGFYSTPQAVSLSSADANTIRYTLDGSEPTATNGDTYSGALTIDGTTTLRVVAFTNSGEASAVETFSYIFLDDVINQSLPSGWPTAPINGQLFDYGMDPEIVNGQDDAVKQSLAALPSLSIVTDLDNLFDPDIGIYVNAQKKGSDWERATSIEWLPADNAAVFQIDAGVRIRGGHSRSGDNPKHSFRLLFNNKYDGTLSYPVFGTEGVDTFKKLDLRTAQNFSWSFEYGERSTFLREVWSRDTQAAMGHPYTRSNYVHLYLNGQYWGLYMTQERLSEEYAQDYFGGKENDYDVLKHFKPGGSNPLFLQEGMYEVASGDDSGWNELWELIEDQFVTDDEYEQIRQQVNLDNLIDNNLLQFYNADYDSYRMFWWHWQRANNWYAVRDHTGGGIKWHFFAHDAEYSLGVAGHDVTENRSTPLPITDNWYYSSDYFFPGWLHQALTSNSQYLDRVHYRTWMHMQEADGVLAPTAARARWEMRKAQVGPAILAESARWGDAQESSPYGVSHWQTETSWVEDEWFPARTEIVIAQLQEQNLAVTSQPAAPPTPTPPAQPTPKVILNEYNAVDGALFLKNGGSDTYFGTVQGNGGDWFELVTVVDHLDIRGWTLELWDTDNFSNFRRRTDSFKFADQLLFSDLRRGTILTIAEDVPDDLSYKPTLGDWWINLQVNSTITGTHFTADTQSNFDTNSKDWQLIIRDATGEVVLGAVGEGTDTLAAGVGNTEIGKLEEDPSTAISASSAYNDGSSSTFGAPNIWSAGTITQDFSTLRSVVEPVALGNVNCDDEVNAIDALIIMQYEVGMRSNDASCPLDNMATHIFAEVGDVNKNNKVDAIDALLIMQCNIGISNAFCSQ